MDGCLGLHGVDHRHGCFAEFTLQATDDRRTECAATDLDHQTIEAMVAEGFEHLVGNRSAAVDRAGRIGALA